MRKTQTFVSLFSGCGGMDLGFEQAGFTGLLACDIDPLVISVHDANLNGRAAVLDLQTKRGRSSLFLGGKQKGTQLIVS